MQYQLIYIHMMNDKIETDGLEMKMSAWIFTGCSPSLWCEVVVLWACVSQNMRLLTQLPMKLLNQSRSYKKAHQVSSSWIRCPIKIESELHQGSTVLVQEDSKYNTFKTRTMRTVDWVECMVSILSIWLHAWMKLSLHLSFPKMARADLHSLRIRSP